MSFQNVQVIEKQETKKSMWGRAVAATAAAGSFVAATSSHALLTAADVTAATTAAGADDTLRTAAIWVIGLTVGIVVVVKIVGMLKK